MATSISCRPSPGLYAPHWRADARGVIAGLTGYATAGHIARAALEATAYQVMDVVRGDAARIAASRCPRCGWMAA